MGPLETAPREGAATRHTVAEWATWEGRWELIDGIPHDMTPGPSYEHQAVTFRLARILADALEALGPVPGLPERVGVAPLDLHLPGRQTVLQPDIAVLSRPEQKSPRGLEGPPDLVVEVLSPGTAAHDHGRKRRAYEEAGVPEYLIVDPADWTATLLRLRDGAYEEVGRFSRGGVLPLLGGTLTVPLGRSLSP